jgi:hypothetical protein
MKRPAFQFYPADWHTKIELQSCSIAARGLWIEMLCIMHGCEPYGHLALGGASMSVEKLAMHAKIPADACETLLKELEDMGIFSRARGGIIYSRRMVRDEAARVARAAGGPAGASAGHEGASHGKKGGRPRKNPPSAKPETPLRVSGKPPLQDDGSGNEKPAPSSSSPSSEANTDRSSSSAARAVEDVSGLVGWLLETLNNPNLVRQPLAEIVREWRATGLDDEAIRVCIAECLAQRRTAQPDWSPASLRYFTPGIKQRAEIRSGGDGASAMPGNPDDDRVQRFRESGFWLPEWDEFPPDDPRCSVSLIILQKYGYRL